VITLQCYEVYDYYEVNDYHEVYDYHEVREADALSQYMAAACGVGRFTVVAALNLAERGGWNTNPSTLWRCIIKEPEP